MAAGRGSAHFVCIERGPPDQGVVEKNWEGLQVAAPKSIVSEVVVEEGGGGHRGSSRVPGGHEGGL